MARPYNDELREAALRAVMECEGFVWNGTTSLLEEARTGNPRVLSWMKKADAVLRVVYPRAAR